MKRLGLDIGTNSIGWCLTEGDQRIVDIGVRIFSDGREPPKSGGIGAPLAEKRRLARGARRRRDRYLGRRSAFLKALAEYGLMPGAADEARQVAERDPYDLRARALDDRLEPYEIGRALFHLNQRRGFKSNRKAERKTQDSEDGKIASGAKALDAAMAAAGARTLGEFLAIRQKDGKHARVRMGGENQDYDFYPQRDHVLDEFKCIWKAQAANHPDLLNDTAFAALYRIIEFQRDLKKQPVGKCTFIHADDRLPKAHPLFQERRLYEEVNQLEITTPGEAPRKLTPDERDALILELRGRRERTFEQLGKRLKLDPGQSFNKASEARTVLRGNEVYASLADKKRFGPEWAHLGPDRQWLVVERLLDEEDPEALHAFLTEDFGLDEERARATAKAPLPEGYGRLGVTATRLILEELKKKVVTYDVAVQRALPHLHHSDFRTGEVLPKLPYYGELLTREIPPGTLNPADPPEVRWGKITNPTVHIGLRQMEKLVNAIIAVHGRPDQIVVELARELKLNEKEKAKHDKRIRKDTAAAIKRSEKLVSMGQPDTGANRMLLRMWEELNPHNPLDRRCPYCAGMIGAELLFNGVADVDHILPYSRTLDDSPANKVVAHRACNRAKGKDTPYEHWGPHRDSNRWEVITAQVARLHKSKQWRFGPDAMERFEGEHDFLARQLTDTQYLSKIGRSYLSSLYIGEEKGEGVYVIPGRMTAMLRRLWGLNDVLGDHNIVENKHSNAPKNRLDHRHHAIDAAVVAVTTRSRLNEIAKAAGRAEDKDLDKQFEGLPEPWNGFRDELREKLNKVTVSHKPDHGRKGRPARERDVTSGKLHDETAYGIVGEYEPGRAPVVVKRVAFDSLEPKDVADPERIRDATLRSELQRVTAGLSGKPFAEALTRFRREHPIFRGIRRVRVVGESAGMPTLNVIPIRDKAGKPFKAYKGNANEIYNVWRMPDGNWVHDVVPTFNFHQADFVQKRPHPAARKVLSLRQNDLLAIERNGGPREIMRVQKYGQNGQIFLIAHNEAGNMSDRNKSADDPFKFYGPGTGSLKAMKARQVRIDPLGRVFDPGPRD